MSALNFDIMLDQKCFPEQDFVFQHPGHVGPLARAMVVFGELPFLCLVCRRDQPIPDMGGGAAATRTTSDQGTALIMSLSRRKLQKS